MKPLSEFWTVYARLQKLLSARAVLDDTSWGLEAVLDCLSVDAEQSLAEDDLVRIRQSKSRKERNQASLRRTRVGEMATHCDGELVLDARQRLAQVQQRATAEELVLLLAADSGVDYEELAASLGVSVGCLRTRVCRLRTRLKDSLKDEGPDWSQRVVWSTAA